MKIDLTWLVFQISCYFGAYVRLLYEKTKGQIPLRPSFGKQNIQSKEVYYVLPMTRRISFFFHFDYNTWNPEAWDHL